MLAGVIRAAVKGRLPGRQGARLLPGGRFGIKLVSKSQGKETMTSRTYQPAAPATTAGPIYRAVCILLACLAAGASLSCLSNPAELGDHNRYEAQFELVWSTFDREYPAFHLLDVDWDAVYEEYLPRFREAEDQAEVIDLLLEMMALLEDAHVYIRTLEGYIYPSYVPDYFENYDEEVLWTYLDSLSDDGFTWFLEDIWGYALFDSVPYVMMATMQQSIDPYDLTQVIDSLGDPPAVIIDVRMNAGGSGGGEVLAKFSTDWGLAYWQVYRSGPDHEDLEQFPVEIYPYPGGWEIPVLYLIGEASASATEMVALQARAMPTVTLAGDTTMGQVTTGPTWNLGYAGFSYRVPSVTILSADETRWIQGNGVAPDICVEATEADFAAGTDPVLEYALEWAAQQ